MDFFRLFLAPFAMLYGLIVRVRNKLFDWGLLPSRSFPLPVISVGNLCVGGTGKTPHIEYLIRLLRNDYRTASLSRGYGRKTKGFILAKETATAETIGDEPLQYATKFTDIAVAVDEDRRHGITQLQKQIQAEVVLLDDAFQHRYVHPGLSILLTDFHNLYTDDYLLPTGSLREPRSGARRADIIIITKTPKVFSPITRRRLLFEIQPKPHQNLFFTFIKYGTMLPFKGALSTTLQPSYSTILLISGIANPYPLQDHLKQSCSELITLKYTDHHQYDVKDLEHITETFNNIFTKNKIIVTTEKDAMRLRKADLAPLIKNLPVFYIPIEIEFHNQDKQKFDKLVKSYISKEKK